MPARLGGQVAGHVAPQQIAPTRDRRASGAPDLHRPASHAAAMAGIAGWSEHSAHVGDAATASTSEEGEAVIFLCLLAVPATFLQELRRSLVMQRPPNTY